MMAVIVDYMFKMCF